MKTIADIKQAYEADRDTDAAIAAYTAIIEAGSHEAAEALAERGQLYWKMERRADAINDYNEALRLDPHSRAQQLKQAAYAILDFYNKDLFNP